MRFGLGIPTCREGLAYPSGFADLQDTAQLAQAAERLGFDSLWANDHLVTQQVVADLLDMPPNFYEPVVVYAYLAAQVPRLQFVLATLVAPLRETVLLAKQIATLDQATQGRVVLGLGIGAYREELEAVNPRSTGINRGRMLDEQVVALRLLFSQRRAAYHGDYVEFAELESFPKSVRQPLPIYLGGNSEGAIARAAAIADGWIVASASPSRTAEAIQRLRDAAVATGRDPAAIDICVQAWVSIGETKRAARERLLASQHFQRLRRLYPEREEEAFIEAFARDDLLGTPEQIRERIAGYGQIGVDHLGLIFLATDLAELRAGVDLFGEEVLPSLRAQ
ncbi:MAG: class flavin-dependent oxidoreductase [Thermomicrobiales bacterium]|nr:class flavin-dependent oxidoreductase [Thermomicrobiales bacterium]